jgi:mono/diheme cytochrome c family protein
MNVGSCSRHAHTLATLALMLATLTSCYPVRRADPIVGPMALSDSHLQRGRLLYDRHCYKCHTEGEGGMGPIINDKPLPKFLMRFQVRAGLGVMPKFSHEQISDDELDDIVDYVVALRHHDNKQ